MIRHQRKHRKSRLGCQQCKTRKVKCDEVSPHCGPCKRHRIPCSFNPSGPAGSPTSVQYIPPLSSATLLDLELLHNFTVKTYKTVNSSVAISAQLADFYRTTFIQHAFAQDFFVHSILGVSAFHLSYLHNQNRDVEPAKRFAISGHTQQNTALQSFRAKLSEITPENCHSIFACSFLMCIMTFASSHPRNHSDRGPVEIKPQSLVKTLPWLSLLRGILPAISPAIKHVSAGPLGPILNRVEMTHKTIVPSMPEAIGAQLFNLIETFENLHDSHLRRVCVNSVARLRTTWIGSGRGTVVPLSFLMEADDEFIELVDSGSNEALVIMAHFCASLKNLSGYWWVEGWPEYILDCIDMMVDDEIWKPWLSWPMDMVYRGGMNLGRGMDISESAKRLKHWTTLVV